MFKRRTLPEILGVANVSLTLTLILFFFRISQKLKRGVQSFADADRFFKLTGGIVEFGLILTAQYCFAGTESTQISLVFYPFREDLPTGFYLSSVSLCEKIFSGFKHPGFPFNGYKVHD